MSNILSQQKWKFFWNVYANYIADRILQSVILAFSCFCRCHTWFATAEEFEKGLSHCN